MIGQLLWMARLRDPATTVNKINVAQTIKAALARFRDQIERRQIVIKLDESFPEAMGHAPWIEEVFANLIGNAIKYMGENNPDPRIEITADHQGIEVCYKVKDHGIGITPQNQHELFKPFTRLGDLPQEGSGLGLSIVKRIVTNLNGRVGLEYSAPGEGSTFWFTLPAAQMSVQFP
jgi:signal transduction histidine kinase